VTVEAVTVFHASEPGRESGVGIAGWLIGAGDRSVHEDRIDADASRAVGIDRADAVDIHFMIIIGAVFGVLEKQFKVNGLVDVKEVTGLRADEAQFGALVTRKHRNGR